MDKNRVFEAIAEERRELAGLLDALVQEQWAVPSLCPAWTVRDVAAHLVQPLITPLGASLLGFAKHVGDLERTNIAMTAQVVRRHGEDLPDLLRTHADSRFTPPLIGPLAPLTDIMVHGQDIRRPLGLSRTFAAERQIAVLDFLLRSPASRTIFRGRGKARWETTDLDWSGGDGDVVRGPAEAVMLALTGRPAALGELSGDGVEGLRAR